MGNDLPTIPDVLHWYDGMLLLPEHFQAAHRRQEMLGGYLARTVAPHGWGVRSLAMRIAEPKLQVAALEAVMPDGLVVQYRGSDDEPLELDLTPWKTMLGAHHRLIVHLVVTAWSDDLTAQDGPEPGGFDRYRSVRGARLERDDANVAASAPAAEQMRERPWLRPILKLDGGDGGPEGRLVEPPPKYVALPLARLVQNPDGAIVFDGYEPPRPVIGDGAIVLEGPKLPRPMIGAPNQLLACAERVAGNLRGKAQFLSEKLLRDRGVPDHPAVATPPADESEPRQAPSEALRRAAASASDADLHQAIGWSEQLQRDSDHLRSVVRTLPRLDGLRKDRSAHPFTIYLALCDIAGDVAMLGPELTLLDVPTYEHRDPLASFLALERHIDGMLAFLDQKYRILRFERVSEGRFELAVEPRDLSDRLILGAVRASGDRAEPVRAWMDKAVISTRALVDARKPQRVRGAERVAIDRDRELDLSAPPLTSLFCVTASPEFIARDDRMLVVENLDPGGPRSILLYAPLVPGDEALAG
jgi:type VI secretion system protein ImpJ